MTTRVLTTVFLALALGGLPLAAQQPGDPDYEPGEDLVEEYELLGEGTDSDCEFDGTGFEQAADRTAVAPPAVVPPSGAEVKEFRVGLEAHWGGNLPALLAYLQSIDPATGDNFTNTSRLVHTLTTQWASSTTRFRPGQRVPPSDAS